MASENIVDVDSETFEQSVLGSDKPVLVDFWAPWCGPCRQIAPVLEELATEHAENLKIAKLDVDQAQDVASRYNVLGIPTLILFKQGEIADRAQGAVPKAAIQDLIARNIDARAQG